jgi:hypothetical protein
MGKWKDRDEFETDMKTRFPLFYKNLGGNINETCMYWGIAVNLGWWNLIEKMSERIEEINKTLETPVVAAQIKQKFATLRVYVDYGTDEVYDIISETEKESQTICESCGTRENVKIRGKHYILTQCLDCFKTTQLKAKNFKW